MIDEKQKEPKHQEPTEEKKAEKIVESVEKTTEPTKQNKEQEGSAPQGKKEGPAAPQGKKEETAAPQGKKEETAAPQEKKEGPAAPQGKKEGPAAPRKIYSYSSQQRTGGYQGYQGYQGNQGNKGRKSRFTSRSTRRDRETPPAEESTTPKKEEIKYELRGINKEETFYGTGRRKSSCARVFMKKGNGQIQINKRPFMDYFTRQTTRTLMLQPLVYIEARDKFDFSITVRGGGSTGQAGAIRHGISRALLSCDENMRKFLRQGDFLTRDSRSVERKKVGLRKARKKPQYSKR